MSLSDHSLSTCALCRSADVVEEEEELDEDD